MFLIIPQFSYSRLLVPYDDIKLLVAIKKDKQKFEKLFNYEKEKRIDQFSKDDCEELNNTKVSLTFDDESNKKIKANLELKLKCDEKDKGSYFKISFLEGNQKNFEGLVDSFEGLPDEKCFLNTKFKVLLYQWNQKYNEKGILRLVLYDVEENKFYISRLLTIKPIK